MSAEVRAMFEIGSTDGSTAVRVLLSESVLRPTLDQTTAVDIAMLVRAALERLGAEAMERALEQADVFTRAMASGLAAVPIVLPDDDGPPPVAVQHFLDSLPEEIQRSKHFAEVIELAAADELEIGNVTREMIVGEVNRREAMDPS